MEDTAPDRELAPADCKLEINSVRNGGRSSLLGRSIPANQDRSESFSFNFLPQEGKQKEQRRG